MNEKLKRLAHNMLVYFPEGENVQNVYTRMKNLAQQQKEYFEYLGPESFIKLTIYIYCLSNFNDLKIADKYINNLLFAKIFHHNGTNHQESCETCDGNGYESCDSCDGSGEVSCSQCSGDGNMTCPECDGEGSIEDENGNTEDCDSCRGHGEIRCDECDGSGEESCYDCGGDGSSTCGDCGGSGEIETEELDYEIETICTWDRTLKNLLETREGELEPALSEDDLGDYYNKIIYLMSDELHLEFIQHIVDNHDEVFCLQTSDEPKLKFEKNMGISWEGVGFEDMRKYTV